MANGIDIDNAKEYDFFISYASINRTPVQELVDRLKADGFKIWFDVDQMVAGRATLGQLIDGIVASRHMLVCLSDPYIERDWTRYELDANQTYDPANQRNRTIPVKIASVTKEVPAQIHHITHADLTDPAKYESEYQRIIRSVLPPTPMSRPPTSSERAILKEKCEAAFAPNNRPIGALLQARVAAMALCKFLYRQELREPSADSVLDTLIKGLVSQTKLSAAIKASLSTMQTYGNWNVEMDEYAITVELVQPALAALKVITDYTFATYFEQPVEDPWESILTKFPHGTDRGEYLIPESAFALKTPPLGVNSLGPLYAGRNKNWGEMVGINLVKLSEEVEGGFNEELTQFFRLNSSRIIRPRDAGRIVVNNQYLCHYVAIEQVDGTTAQDLINTFGSLPPLATCELCLGVALALVSFHSAEPTIVHGDIKPANVIIDTYSEVKVLCLGRNSHITAEDAASGAAQGKIDSFLFASPEQLAGIAKLSPITDLFALSAMLFYLLTGEYESNQSTGTLTRTVVASAQRTWEQLKDCQTAHQAVEILERACKQLAGSGINLRIVNQCFLENKELPDPVEEAVLEAEPVPLEPPLPPSVSRSFSLVNQFKVNSRSAWYLGDQSVLIWEAATGTLSILKDSEMVWRDSLTIPIRQIVQGPALSLAVTSWEGHIRLFRDGNVTASTQVRGGTIGDIQFCAGNWIVGTWQGPLYRLSQAGDVRPLSPAIDKGTLRIAVMDGKDVFAVADLSGSIAIYADGTRSAPPTPPMGMVTSMAFAGQRLMLLANQTLFSLNRGGQIGPPERQLDGENARILPAPYPASCLLLTQTGESWVIDQVGRHLPYCTLPSKAHVASTCDQSKRFTVALPTGGYAYWRDNTEIEVWATALAANLSPDGHFIAVTLPNHVLLYEDPA